MVITNFSTTKHSDTDGPLQGVGQSRYGWLAEVFKNKITHGLWVGGTAIPAEAMLSKQYNVALGTLRQAITILVSQGYLEKHHGRGTFVRTGLTGASMMRFFKMHPCVGQNAELVPKSTILQRAVMLASDAEALAFGMPQGSSVLGLKRLRSVQNEPIVLENITLPLPLFEVLQDSQTALWDDLLYPMYQSELGITVHRAVDNVGFELMSTDQATLLKRQNLHPCVTIHRHAYDLTGRCVELRTSYGDAFAFNYSATIQ